jgi:hypothetical protein
MYDIGSKTRVLAVPVLAEIDESLLIAELMMKETTTSGSSNARVSSLRMSPLLRRQSQGVEQVKQQERKALKSLADAVNMLRHKNTPSGDLLHVGSPRSIAQRSVSLDPTVTANVFRKALRTNSSKQSRRVSMNFINILLLINQHFVSPTSFSKSITSSKTMICWIHPIGWMFGDGYRELPSLRCPAIVSHGLFYPP